MTHEQKRLAHAHTAMLNADCCKAMRAELLPLISRVPPRVASGSHQIVTAWKAAREHAAKVVAGSRSKPEALQEALYAMRRFL